MRLLRFLLFPFSILYDIITTIRNLLYDKGFMKSTSFKVPVLAVGNLNVGGTGKSPQIEYLIRLLKEDYKVAVLSRGYKRKLKGFLLVNENHNAEDVGDEPMQFFKKFKDIIVSVDSDRVRGIKKILNQNEPPNIVLLDDAYQHRKVKAKAYILLTKYDDLFINDFLLPAGNLRESRRGVERANIIVVTKCPKNLSVESKTKIIKKLSLQKRQQIFFSTIQYSKSIKGSLETTLEELKNYKVILVTGIANSNSIVDFLSEKNIDFCHLNFPDHHNFSVRDIKNIKNTFNKLNFDRKIILTTEKDYVRLDGKSLILSYLPIRQSFLESHKNFDNEIKKYINS